MTGKYSLKLSVNSDELKCVVDFSVFVDTDSLVAIGRAQHRDMTERNHSEESWQLKKVFLYENYRVFEEKAKNNSDVKLTTK